QSETTLRSMVDFFLLLLLPGAGDELQGIKRGIMEMADAVLVNKADGDNRTRAEAARSEQSLALHHLAAATPGWKTPVASCSGMTGEGILDAWLVVDRFYTELGPSGVIEARRREQMLRWVDDLVRDELLVRFRDHPGIRRLRPELDRAVLGGGLTAVRAARTLLDAFASRPTDGASTDVPGSTDPNPLPVPPC
ncbi:MAG: methylmalonyl Co-A mutase-associated GTPase MeaB, partial [Planctomycetota bacterium]|nr:methylmalonyl Co-A mutase-associated GTPase MeaB [Planctomycetota bacterium]